MHGPRSTKENVVVLGILEAVASDSNCTQRRLAADLGIALGLANAYLRRCMKKGLVKVREVPTRRYAYYLTPKGLSEKSRLTVEYLSSSFTFFRRARAECAQIFLAMRQAGVDSVVLAGASDLAEISLICALDGGVKIVGLVDSSIEAPTFAGLPVAASFDAVSAEFGAILITAFPERGQIYRDACRVLPADKVFLPVLLKFDLGVASVGGQF